MGAAPVDETCVLLEGDWTHRFVFANGSRFHIAEAGTGPLVLLLHGFPEFWGAWQHQLLSLAERGSAPSRLTCADTGQATNHPVATTATPWRPTSPA